MNANRHALAVLAIALVGGFAMAGGFGGSPGSTCSGAASVASLTSSGAITAASFSASGIIATTAGTSQTGISMANCSRIIQTGTAGNYLSPCDGVIRVGGDISMIEGGLTMTGVSKFVDLFGTMAIRNSQTGAPLLVNDVDGLRITAQATVGKTCGTGADTTTVGPGTIIPVSPSGGKGRLCVCMLDDATYLWVNMRAPGEAGGNTTTCPATP